MVPLLGWSLLLISGVHPCRFLALTIGVILGQDASRSSFLVGCQLSCQTPSFSSFTVSFCSLACRRGPEIAVAANSCVALWLVTLFALFILLVFSPAFSLYAVSNHATVAPEPRSGMRSPPAAAATSTVRTSSSRLAASITLFPPPISAAAPPSRSAATSASTSLLFLASRTILLPTLAGGAGASLLFLLFNFLFGLFLFVVRAVI
mmetsp:Transcript_76657/g.169399  ORF Transcript_76657/g.169399 Transcript_76657/m.169399 type:complete len:206 (+) Transcript_76657:1194-1811(+)